MKTKKYFYIFMFCLLMSLIICSIVLEINRIHGKIDLIHDQHHTAEKKAFIKNMSNLYTPYIILSYTLGAFIFFHSMKFLFKKFYKGNIFKNIAILIAQFFAIFQIIIGYETVANSQFLLNKTGEIVIPIYKVILPYATSISLLVLSWLISQNIKKRYEKEIKRNKKTDNYKEWLKYKAKIKQIAKQNSKYK